MTKKILLIEDDLTMSSLLKTLFELEKYIVKISTPSDISQVKSIIVEFEPDVLLFDVHLKNANGLDLANKLKVAGELDNRILIMASGMDLEKECKQAGASLFLLKPYHPDHLINWLREHI